MQIFKVDKLLTCFANVARQLVMGGGGGHLNEKLHYSIIHLTKCYKIILTCYIMV